MSIPKFCPICGEILVLVDHQMPDGTPYQQWECPEGDWYDPLSRIAPDATAEASPAAEAE